MGKRKGIPLSCCKGTKRQAWSRGHKVFHNLNTGTAHYIDKEGIKRNGFVFDHNRECEFSSCSSNHTEGMDNVINSMDIDSSLYDSPLSSSQPSPVPSFLSTTPELPSSSAQNLLPPPFTRRLDSVSSSSASSALSASIHSAQVFDVKNNYINKLFRIRNSILCISRSEHEALYVMMDVKTTSWEEKKVAPVFCGLYEVIYIYHSSFKLNRY